MFFSPFHVFTYVFYNYYRHEPTSSCHSLIIQACHCRSHRRTYAKCPPTASSNFSSICCMCFFCYLSQKHFFSCDLLWWSYLCPNCVTSSQCKETHFCTVNQIWIKTKCVCWSPCSLQGHKVKVRRSDSAWPMESAYQNMIPAPYTDKYLQQVLHLQTVVQTDQMTDWSTVEG